MNMTMHQNYKITDIWEKQRINRLAISHSNPEPTSRGNGIFVLTKTGDIVFDLRNYKERIFLGHAHPLWVKINSWKGTIKTQLVPIKFEKAKNDYKIQTDSIFINDNNLFGFPPDPSAMRGFKISLLDLTLVECRPKEIKNPSFQEKFAYFLSQYCDNFIFHPQIGKNKRDKEIIDRYIVNNDLTDLISRKGRELSISSSFSEALLQSGILHSVEDDKVILCFPLACTENEIIQSLSIVNSIVKGC